MPHGSLTPLGNRLRSVLAALRPDAIRRDNPLQPLQCLSSYTINASTRRPRLPTTPSRHLSGTATCRRAQHEAAAPAVETLGDPLGETAPHTAPPAVETLGEMLGEAPSTVKTPQASSRDTAPAARVRSNGRLRENRRTKVDYLSNELRAVGKSEIAPQRPRGRRRDNHFAHRSRDAKQTYAANNKRHASDCIPPLETAVTPTLTRILASYLRHATNNATDLQVGCVAIPSFQLSPNDRRFLARIGCGMADVEAWAAMISEPDSFKAASLLHARVASHGTRSVPLPIISYILRRPYITANALRIFMEHVWLLTSDLSGSAVTSLSPDAVFVVFSRLARHARDVWPGALPSVSDYLLKFLPEPRPDKDGDPAKSAQLVTFMLNKAMHLTSEPTAVSPYKDVKHQEAAIIRILSAMAEHDPPLQIDREGYRAVIRLQLAMGKTDSEQQWAALKALSWPPWKEDRTRMDSELGPEHGISRARATLNRMKEAGYAPQSWEEIAGVYTGWDVDGTPTIQTRVVLPVWSEGKQVSGDKIAQRHVASLWAARIKTTRTVQEAWACYLAFEDSQHPADQLVLLAILEKLHKEESRQRKSMATDRDHLEDNTHLMPRLFPGDTKEVQPLPPSTHLYTYTRTHPPSAHEFYRQLQDHDIELRDECLAFLISNANSFKEGVEYVRSAEYQYPAVGGVHTIDARFPDVLFFAYVKFLSRYSNAHSPRLFRGISSCRLSLNNPSAQLADTQFNFRHNLIQAMWLLKERRPFFLPVWNAVLNALAHEASYKTMHLTESFDTPTGAMSSPDLDSNTIVAYRLTQQVLRLLQDQNMVPDTYGFLAICRSTENAGVACWRILARDYESDQTATNNPHAAKNTLSKPALDARELLANQRPYGRLEQYFKLLVGEESFAGLNETTLPSNADIPSPDDNGSPTLPSLPHLLAVPEPALLHAYIRALGWHGSHTRILTALKWMVKHQAELAEASDRARNGARLMRRAVVAVRVFFERSWVLEYDGAAADSGADADDDADWQWRGEKPDALKRLEARAYESQVEEARGLVESVEGWGGWATDEEVEVYCRDRRFGEVA